MKQKQANINKKIGSQSGFTVIELLVVLSVMVMIATVLTLDFSRQRDARSIVLAKNETVTGLRKVQNYMLTSKNISTDVQAKFYIAQFNLSNAMERRQFRVHALDNDFVMHSDIETISLPSNVGYTSLTIDPASKGQPVLYDCVNIIFSAPFGKMYTYGSLECDNYQLALMLKDPVALSQLSQRRATLQFGVGTNTASIVVNPVTGQITDL